MTVFEQVKDALHGQEAVWVDLLANSVHEDGQVVMVVELVDLNFPCDFVLGTVLNLDGKVSPVVELAELSRQDLPSSAGASSGCYDSRLSLGLLEGASVTTEASLLR